MELLVKVTGSRGDVIAAQKDGWPWSVREKVHPDWIILTANITDVEAEALTEPARPGDASFIRHVGFLVSGFKAGDVITRAELVVSP